MTILKAGSAQDQFGTGGGGGTPDDDSVTSAKIVDATIATADIGDGQVTTAKLHADVANDIATDPALTAAFEPLRVLESATVNTSQTTTSTSFTDLATVGPEVTVTVPASGKVKVTITVQESSTSSFAIAGVALSGANTAAAMEDESAIVTATTSISASRTFVMEGLTAGSTTFTMKYRVGSGTGTFSRREIVVETLP